MRRKKAPRYTLFAREKSEYASDDWRSRLYKREWVKKCLNKYAQEAIQVNKSIYEVMWKNANDKEEHLPNVLFKFYPFNENSLKCIEQNKVFMNIPDNFNDPYDCFICANQTEFEKQYLIDYIKSTNAVERGVISKQEFGRIESSVCKDWIDYGGSYSKTFDSVLNSIYYNNGNYNEKINELFKVCYKARIFFLDTIDKLRKQNIRVTSFAHLENDRICTYMELWGHYAQSHQGLCVEYDLGGKIQSCIDEQVIKGALFPCKYTARPTKVSKTYFYKYAMGKNMTAYQNVHFIKNIIDSFLTKSSAWSYENEWRIILPNEVCEFYDNMIPFYPIKKIYLGCKMSKDNREYIYRMSEKQGFKVVNMLQLHDEFRLEDECVDIDKYFKDQADYRQKEINSSKYEILKDDILNY